MLSFPDLPLLFQKVSWIVFPTSHALKLPGRDGRLRYMW